MFLHNISVQDQLISADGLQNFDLAVNPLSVVLLCLRPLNDTGTLTDFPSYIQLAQAMNRVSVLHNGTAVKSMRGEDLAAMNYFRHGIMPFQGQHDETNNERRCAVVPILMGRFPYDPNSIFPATKRGELILEIDFDIADTGYDGLRFSVETIEILDAKPKEFERAVQVQQTFGAVGDNDVDLAVRGMCRGILVWGTTPFAGATPAPSWGRMRTTLDSREVGYAGTDFEVAQMLHCLWGRQPPMYDFHKHNFEPVAGTVTIGRPFDIGLDWHQYAFMDFDP